MSARQPLPKWAHNILMPAMNVALALIVGGLAVAVIGENPFEAMQVLAYGAFGYGTGLGFTLHYATSLTFTGLAVAVAYHAGLFNIGGEGQAYVAGLGAIMLALWLDQTHWVFVLFASMIAAMAMGALWAAIPGYLQAKRGSHIVITTIMFNFIASAFMSYMLAQVITNPGSNAETRTIAETGRLPLLAEYFPYFKYSPVNITFIFGILALIFVYVLIWRTKLGKKIRTLGANPEAARYAGISAVSIIVIAMAIAGALAGMMAVNEAIGVQKRLVVGYVQGFGFIGIAVAFMGRAHPVGIALSALLFGALYQGGQELAFVMPAVPSELVVVIQALVILFSGAMDEMFKPVLERVFGAFRSPSADAEQSEKKEA